MDIVSVEFILDEDGLVDSFLVNEKLTVMNGEDIESVEEVRQWLIDNNRPVPEYSSIKLS